MTTESSIGREAQRLGPAAGNAAIEVSALNVHYGDLHVLDDIHLTIPAGQFVSVIGPSGCGKSTLLNVLGGFVTPSSGEVLLTGKSPRSRGLARGVVFQEYALFPWRTARRNVELSFEQRDMSRAERRERAMEFLRLVKLEAFADSFPHQLSGGMKQRVAIARALACEPEVLLMDEPLGALDALTRESLMDLIADIWSRTRQTVVYITHNVTEAAFLGDRVVVFTPGPPGRIKADIQVDLPRPRSQLSDGVVAYQRQLTELVSDDRSADGRS